MARMKHIVRSYHQARDTFARFARTPKHGGPMRVNLGYATWLHERIDGWEQPSMAVRFHATDVVTFHPDGSITLATDGWFTKTTRERIEDYTPAEVWVRTKNVPRRSGSDKPVEFFVMVGNGDGQQEYDMTEQATVRIIPHD